MKMIVLIIQVLIFALLKKGEIKTTSLVNIQIINSIVRGVLLYHPNSVAGLYNTNAVYCISTGSKVSKLISILSLTIPDEQQVFEFRSAIAGDLIFFFCMPCYFLSGFRSTTPVYAGNTTAETIIFPNNY